jgi:hypothetical protein
MAWLAEQPAGSRTVLGVVGRGLTGIFPASDAERGDKTWASYGLYQN